MNECGLILTLRYETVSDLYPVNYDAVKTRLDQLLSERSQSSNPDEDHSTAMICKSCREKHYSEYKLTTDYIPTLNELKTKPFIFGSISYRIESLRGHCKTSNTHHYLALKRTINIAKESSQGQMSDAQRVKTTLTEAQKKHLNYLFINMYGVLKRGKPFTTFEFIIDLDKAKGVDIGKTYLNRQAGLEFGKAIGEVFLDELRRDFYRAKFFSFTMDESTDTSRKEQCIMFLRYSVNGKVKTRFLAVDNVTRPTAAQLTELVLKMLKGRLQWEPPNVVLSSPNVDNDYFEEGISSDEESFHGFESEEVENDDQSDLENDDNLLVFDELNEEIEIEIPIHADERSPLLVGITTDGASVLTGNKTGVQKRIKDLCNKNIIATHCLSHRTQLAIKDSCSQEALFKKLFLFCEQLFVFHHTSAVITAVYRKSVEVLQIKGI